MQGLQEPVAGKERDLVGARVNWLTSASSSTDTGADQPLRRAQCHLSMLHRISDVFSSARLDALADAIAATIDAKDGTRSLGMAAGIPKGCGKIKSR